jgi:hypothetical protein
LKASPQNQRVVSPKPGKLVEVDGRIMGVNVVGEMVEVGGKVIEVDEVEEEVPLEVPLEDAGATGVLGAAGFEAGRVNASEGGGGIL